MKHPFCFLMPEYQRRLFLIFLAFSAGLSVVMSSAGGPLKTPQAPGGIVSFEFAWSLSGAQTILDGWDETAKVQAGFVQGLDYLYLVVYAQAFALACLLAGQRLDRVHWPGAGWGGALAWGMWLAAVLDAVENLALVSLLFGAVNEYLPVLAGICATAKFSLLFIGLVYSAAGWIAGRLKPISV